MPAMSESAAIQFAGGVGFMLGLVCAGIAMVINDIRAK
jgi:hypothetical protein